LPVPTLAAIPLVACVWATCAGLAFVDHRRGRYVSSDGR
jgi:hypothetical protein